MERPVPVVAKGTRRCLLFPTGSSTTHLDPGKKSSTSAGKPGRSTTYGRNRGRGPRLRHNREQPRVIKGLLFVLLLVLFLACVSGLLGVLIDYLLLIIAIHNNDTNCVA